MIQMYMAHSFDFGIRSADGYDSFLYDLRIMMTAFTKSSRKLNRYYEFTVSVTDGDTIRKKRF